MAVTKPSIGQANWGPIINAALDALDADVAAKADASTVAGKLTAASNLSDVASAATARTNLSLGNVTNTSDASKPVSTAQQTALDLKAPTASPTFTGTVSGITKTMVGLGSVENLSTSGIAAAAALTNVFTKVEKPEAYGAVGNGTTNDATAIQAAADAAATNGTLFYAEGNYAISSTITIKSHADLSRATFHWTGANTGTAVQIGVGTSGVLLYNKRIATPAVLADKVGTGWSGSSVGIKVVNTQSCQIAVARVTGFVTGLYVYGLGAGNVYNDIYLLHMENSKRNLVLGAGTGGWSNSNIYHLGSLSHESAEGTNVSGTRQILIETATNLVNGNRFLGGSVEGATAEYHLDCDGPYNRFDGVRWENSGGCRAIWRANATRNIIDYGYTAENVVETHVAGSNFNRIITTGMSYVVGSSSKAVQWLENATGGTVAADVVMDPGARVAGSDAATAYRVYRTANSTKMKRATDTYDRLQLDHDNARVYFGPGTATPTIYFGMVGSSGVKLDGGNLYFNADNTYDVGLDATSLRPRDIFVGRKVVVGTAQWLFGTGTPEASKTAPVGSLFSRTDGAAATTLYVKESGAGNTGWVAPRGTVTSTTAALAAVGNAINTAGKGTGDMVFNTTTSKPVWSTGTTAASVWVDATGATAHTPA